MLDTLPLARHFWFQFTSSFFYSSSLSPLSFRFSYFEEFRIFLLLNRCRFWNLLREQNTLLDITTVSWMVAHIWSKMDTRALPDNGSGNVNIQAKGKIDHERQVGSPQLLSLINDSNFKLFFLTLPHIPCMSCCININRLLHKCKEATRAVLREINAEKRRKNNTRTIASGT